VRRYIVRRLFQSAIILFVLSVTVFLLLRVAPGADPAVIRCGLTCTKPQLAALHEEMGLDDPYFPAEFRLDPVFITFHGDSQYGAWAKAVVTGSLGKDWNDGDVVTELKQRLPITGELLVITLAATMMLGVPFGIVSAVSRNSPADYSVRFAAILGLAVPNFWLRRWYS